MVQLNFNAQEVAPSQGFQVYPSGNYDVMINSSELKPTKAKTAGTVQKGAYIQFNLRIAAGEHAGGVLIARVNFENDNPTAEEIGQAELSAICRVCGVMQLQDTQQLHGIPFKVTVAKIERDDKPGSFNNEIKAYMDTAGNGPADAGKPAAGEGNAAFGATQPNAPTPPVVTDPTPPVVLTRPSDAAHIHEAGTPNEKWWDGKEWQTPPVASSPPVDPAPTPTTPPAPTEPEKTETDAGATAPPPWA